ncbi:MAG: mechanosensitive ion channel, partial [Proteobacteria bacterium]|nr:mechanosensitive ion channel [Pseudomonadota bacterium]
MPKMLPISDSVSRLRRSALRVLLLLLALGVAPHASALEEFISPLEPADTSSPRATLKSFRDNYDRAMRVYYEVRSRDLVDRAAQVRALRTLDTSKLPPAQARRLAGEAMILLYEVLDKVELPPYEEIPDAAAMLALPAGEPRRWRLPGTEFIIEHIDEGSRKGEYLISSNTVGRAKEFYDQARNLSYQPGAMEGFYEDIISEGGSWIPANVIHLLPDWAEDTLWGQAAWKWLAMALTFGVWLLSFYVLRRLSHPRDGEPHYWLRFLLTVLMLPLTKGIRWFMDQQLVIAGTVFEVVDTSILVLYYLVGAAVVLNLGAAVASSLISTPRVDKDSIDANLISVGTRTVAWLLAILLLAKGASDLGVPLAAVVTSLGVGGLAVAMAARPTLENLIAGVTLYLDKPVRIGQFCQFEDVLGSVERIGLRSTRIRRWGGNVLSIPNAQFAEYQLDNYNDAKYIWIR